MGELTCTMESSDGANLLTSMGFLHQEAGELQLALEKLESAVSIRSRANSLQDPSGKELLVKVAELRQRIAAGTSAVMGTTPANAPRVEQGLLLVKARWLSCLTWCS